MAKKVKQLQPEVLTTIRRDVFSVVEAHLPDRFFLVAVDLDKEHGTWYLRIYVEGRGFSLSIEDCASLTQVLDPQLEDLSILGELPSYHLEVSSPGLFRELTTSREFEFYRERRVRIVPSEGKPERLPVSDGYLKEYDIQQKQVCVQPIPLSSQENPRGGESPVVLSLEGPPQLHVYLNPDVDTSSRDPVLLS